MQRELPPAPLPPRLAFRSRTLDNGLTVLSAESHKSPTVAIQVWYRVGGKDDPEGRAGFAHLFEHLMFKRTRNLPDEGLDRLTEDIGGENNAYTTADTTVYHEVVPSHYLDTLLWAEAERMAHLQVEQAIFHSERNVVKEEFRQSVLSAPYGRFDEAAERLSWSVHPYRHGVIGDLPQLDSASLDDVLAFHRTFYRPDNATLIVVGDFDPGRLDAAVDRYFARIARPQERIPRVTAVEPPRRGERRLTETAPGVPLPALLWNFIIPSVRHEDAPALRLLDGLLSYGQSSRLFQGLVYRRQVATDATSFIDLRSDAGLLTLRAIAAEKKPLDAVEQALREEVERLQSELATPAELGKVKDQIITGVLHQRETAAGIAGALGEAAVLQGDPERVNTELRQLQRVTPEQIRSIARRYLTPENRLALRYVSGPDRFSAVSAVGDTAPPAPPRPTPEETPPAPTTPRRVNPPAFQDRKLASGLRLLTAPRPETGLVSLELRIRAGAASDPAGQAGLAQFLATALTRGTRARSAEQIARDAEALGGSLSASADWNSISLGIDVPRTRLSQALALLAEVARTPAFATAEIERLRAERRNELTVALQEPGTIAMAVAARLAYVRSPYGNRIDGTPASLQRIGRNDLIAFHRALFRPERAILTIAGDVTPDTALAAAQGVFGDWRPAPTRPRPAPRLQVPPVTRHVVLVDKRDAGQSAIVLIRPGIPRTDPAYYRALLANTVLGGGMSGRLNQEVRIKRGLAYGAFSGLAMREGAGPLILSAQSKHESAARVAGLMSGVLERLPLDPIPAAELTARKASLIGPFAREMETADGLGEALASLARFDLPLTELAAFPDRIQAVTEADIQKFAGSRLAARYTSIVVVGDGRQVLAGLKERFGRVTVIPYGQLDLDSPSLRKR